jgi:hypothetical protein
MKRRIKLTESDLHRMIKESVRQVINEGVDGFSETLSVELYNEEGVFGAYISDNNGGSGYDCKGRTPEECGQQVAQYIVDMFYQD